MDLILMTILLLFHTGANNIMASNHPHLLNYVYRHTSLKPCYKYSDVVWGCSSRCVVHNDPCGFVRGLAWLLLQMLSCIASSQASKPDESSHLTQSQITLHASHWLIQTVSHHVTLPYVASDLFTSPHTASHCFILSHTTALYPWLCFKLFHITSHCIRQASIKPHCFTLL